MNRKQLFKRLRYRMQFVPFTRNTLVVAAVVAAAAYFLRTPQDSKAKTDALLPFVRIMSIFSAWLLIGFAAISVCSAGFCWLYYLWLRRNGKTGMNVQTNLSKDGSHRILTVRLPAALKPLLGYLKGRLVYNDLQLTDRFGIQSSERKKNSLLRAALKGESRLLLPDIREYQLRGGILYFEDFLQIISLPVAEEINGSFYQAPELKAQSELTINPKKTDSLDVRIDELRKVEGEYLNYKDYEPGDDVRRIVWKVFARNRSLVVRVPERMEPYASHIYFYASFYMEGSIWAADAYVAEMLNYYKSQVWSVYNELSKKEWQLRYVPDQELKPGSGAEAQQVERLIANSDWHSDKNLDAFFSAKKGSILIVHSFTDPDALQRVIEESDASLKIIFVPLSHCFRSLYILSWLSRILFVPGKDRLAQLKSKWVLSPMRRKVLKRERKLEELIRGRI
jgi:hypothetical protein